MRFATWNVNGLRSVVRSDFEAWLTSSEYDVVCLQETKVGEDLLTSRWFAGYDTFWNPAQRSGYGGVATLVRCSLNAKVIGAGVGDTNLDQEGRVLIVEAGGIRFVNVYAPHSHRKLLRREAKGRFLDALERLVAVERGKSIPMVLLGDFNVAHEEIDLANPRANRGNAGFLPEEREWVDRLLNLGFIDAFRRFEPKGGHYTWWSMRPGVRDRNVGWRLDYVFVDALLGRHLVSCCHLPERRGSDHCPVEVHLAMPSQNRPTKNSRSRTKIGAEIVANSRC